MNKAPLLKLHRWTTLVLALPRRPARRAPVHVMPKQAETAR